MAPAWVLPATKDFFLSRVLRALILGFMGAILAVTLVINLIAFVWDHFIRGLVGGQAYSYQIVFIVPTILLVSIIFAKFLWDANVVRAPQRVREPGVAAWQEPTTHAKTSARRRYDPGAAEAEADATRSGPTGPSGYGGPSGGWDKPRIP